jgi:deoxyadenosine/deoxycytidine kinase
LPDDSTPDPKQLKIGLVGPCGAGKTTIAHLLRQNGCTRVKHIAQEHSFVPAMWQRLVAPDVLVFLDVSYENTVKRRALHWTPHEYDEQIHRLRHARQHADLVIDTNSLAAEDVLRRILLFLQER